MEENTKIENQRKLLVSNTIKSMLISKHLDVFDLKNGMVVKVWDKNNSIKRIISGKLNCKVGSTEYSCDDTEENIRDMNIPEFVDGKIAIFWRADYETVPDDC